MTMQHGVSALVGITSRTTHLEHSIGAMLLTRRLDATLLGQMAALLYDVSHTAMSHVIDYVYWLCLLKRRKIVDLSDI